MSILNSRTGGLKTATTLLRFLIPIEAVTFLIGALLHLGVRIPLGFVVLAEPVIVPAAIVEGLCGLALVIAAYAMYTHKSWAWSAALVAHIFALGGVLLGMWSLASGLGPRTELNDAYHSIILVTLVISLGLLLLFDSQAIHGRGNEVS